MNHTNPETEQKKIKKKGGWFKQEYLIVIVIILIVLLVYILISPLFTNLVGQKAPDFTVISVDGQNFTLSESFGKVLVLDLMSTTCSACIKEMEHLQGIFQRYSPNDVMIITIDIEKSDSNTELMTFKSEHGDNWTFARDTDDIANKYKVRYIPTIVIIDRDGIIRYWGAGELSEQRMSEEIDKLI